MLFSFVCPKNVLKWLFLLRNLLIGLDRLITVSTSEIEGGRGSALSSAFMVASHPYKSQSGKLATDRTMDF